MIDHPDKLSGHKYREHGRRRARRVAYARRTGHDGNCS